MPQKEKCPYCKRYFARIQQHFQKSPACRSQQDKVGFLHPPLVPIHHLQSNTVSTRTSTHPNSAAMDHTEHTEKSKANATSPQIHQPNTRTEDVPPQSEEESPMTFVATNLPSTLDQLLDDNASNCFLTEDFGSDNHSSIEDDPRQQNPPFCPSQNKAFITPSSTLTALGIKFEEVPIGQPRLYTIDNQIQHTTSNMKIDPIDKVLAKIHHTCDQAGAPRYLADDILSIVRKETELNKFNISKTTQRESLMARIEKSIKAKPVQAITVVLESGRTTTVYRFDFMDRLQRHLMSPVYANLDNINLPTKGCENSPFELPSPPQDYSDMTNGEWYSKALEKYKHLLSSGKYILHPLILYGDKTGVDSIEKNSLEPMPYHPQISHKRPEKIPIIG